MFENEGQATEQPVESPEVTQESTQEQTSQAAAPSIPDLDSMERFKYAGRELTPKELQSMVLMQSDYTKKTQALAEERKYYDNLSADLAAVKANPAMVEKFKSIYPEKFHSYLGYVTPAQHAQAQQAQQAQQYAQIDPQVMQRFQALEADMNTRAVAAINAELDAKFKTLSEKFPYSDEESAIARAQALIDRGEKLTDKVWEGIWKSVHEKNEAKFKQLQSQAAQKQKSANAKGKDVASGGGIPGQAPVKPKTIKEATKYALEAMDHL
jgi:hypothetical protein